jgi:uncharacterized damage-inducible protein DinB
MRLIVVLNRENEEGGKQMTSTEQAQTTTAATGERADLLQTLANHRGFLRQTVRGLTDEQAGLRPTVSQLCLGGLIKHVAAIERSWAAFILGGAQGMFSVALDWEGQHRMLEGETLAGYLADYEETARRTDEIVATLPDLDASHPLPDQPWFEKGASWSARRVLLHVIAETSQHAGHADIIREAIDGAKTMG